MGPVVAGKSEVITLRLYQSHPSVDEVFEVPVEMLADELHAGPFDRHVGQLGDIRVLQTLHERDLPEQRSGQSVVFASVGNVKVDSAHCEDLLRQSVLDCVCVALGSPLDDAAHHP